MLGFCGLVREDRRGRAQDNNNDRVKGNSFPKLGRWDNDRDVFFPVHIHNNIHNKEDDSNRQHRASSR